MASHAGYRLGCGRRPLSLGSLFVLVVTCTSYVILAQWAHLLASWTLGCTAQIFWRDDTSLTNFVSMVSCMSDCWLFFCRLPTCPASVEIQAQQKNKNHCTVYSTVQYTVHLQKCTVLSTEYQIVSQFGCLENGPRALSGDATDLHRIRQRGCSAVSKQT